MNHRTATAGIPRPLLLLSLVLLGASAGSAQRMTCQRMDNAPREIRLEGTAELLPDVVLSCTGGQPVTGGAALPRYNFLVRTDGAFVPRAAQKADQSIETFLDALILVGEPGPGQQVACVPGKSPAYCAPSAAGKPLPAGTMPNVFSGKLLQNNLIGFSDIPLDAPGSGKSVTVRIVNLRVNAASLGLAPKSVSTSVQIYDDNGSTLAVGDSQRLAAQAAPAVQISLRTSTGAEPAAGEAPLTMIPTQISRNGPLVSGSFQLRFKEGFASSFRRRSIAVSPLSPDAAADQFLPGLDYQTESGFNNSSFPADAHLNRAGVADSGTRLHISVAGIPDNTMLWVSTRDISDGTTGYSTSAPRAILKGADSKGAGTASPPLELAPGYAQLLAVDGKASATWEVVTADPYVLENITFSLALTANLNSSTGTATFRASISPIDDGTTRSALYTPRFEDRSLAGVAFRIANSIKAPMTYQTSAASFQTVPLAPGSLVAAFGSGFSTQTIVAPQKNMDSLDGLTVEVIDNTGTKLAGTVVFVSPNQVNYRLPDNLRTGPAVVNFQRAGITLGTGVISVQQSSPGLFAANGNGMGVAAAHYLRLGSGDGAPQPVAEFNASRGEYQPLPLPLAAGEQMYLTLYGTGIRGNKGVQGVEAKIAGVSIPVLFAGPQPEFPGLDQINIGPLPLSLAGKRDAPLQVTVGEQVTNALTISFR